MANLDVAKANRDLAAAEPGVHQGHRAGQRARQPIRRHGGQPDPVGGPERRHPAHHHRVGGPDVRLLRRGRAHRAARPAVDPRRQGQVGPRDRVARVAGPGQRGGISPPGHDQFRGQPGQSEDRHPARPGRVPQQGRGALPRLFRPRPCAHRSSPPGPAGHRPRHRHRPGPEDPLRRQREERGGLPPRPAGSAPRRPAGDRRRPEAGRAGDRQRPATGAAGRHGRAEAGGHADLKSQGPQRVRDSLAKRHA